MRFLNLTHEELEILYRLLDMPAMLGGQNFTELKLVNRTMNKIEDHCGINEQFQIKEYRPMEIEIEEGVYNLLKERLERSSGWVGSGRSIVLTFENKLINAQILEEKKHKNKFENLMSWFKSESNADYEQAERIAFNYCQEKGISLSHIKDSDYEIINSQLEVLKKQIENEKGSSS